MSTASLKFVRQYRVSLIAAVSGLLSVPGTFHSRVAEAADPSVERRIARVQNELLPPVIIAGESTRTQTLAGRMEALNVPGVSITVIRDGKIDWARGFGVARPDGSMVTSQTLFQACSISKPVSATAILHLVQQGKLDLDADVNSYLKSWKLPGNELTTKAKVTIRGLLNHTAGVTISGFPGYLSGSPLPSLAKILAGESPANTPPIRVDMLPGIGFRYSGGGYLVAQQVVEDVTGKPFATVVRDTVLTPAHMSASVYEQPLQPALSRKAVEAYDEHGDPIAGGPRIYLEIAPAGLWSTPSDLAKWAIEIQRALSGRSKRILSQSTVQQMLTPGLESWGLGPALGGRPEHRYFTHSGVCTGIRTYLLAYNQGDGIVVMTNGTNGTVLQNDIVRTVAEEYGWPDFRPAVHRISHAGSHDDSVIVGTYQLSRYTAMKVMQEGERLFVQRSGQGRLEMLPEGHDRYFLRDVDCQFTFDFDPAGRATGFASLQNGQIELAKAITESQSEAVTISLAQKLHDKKADPRSESALRRYIEELRAASVDYGRLSAAAAQMTRARQSEFTTMIVDLGKVQSISFEGVAPNGADIFHIQFENGAMRWQIVPTENGNVDQLGFTFMIKSVG